MPDYMGQQLGNYRLIRLLGEGGFAQVYLGEHVHLKTTAAIKVLLRNFSENNLQEFLTEARTIARLRHAQMVRVLEFGIENNVPFLVMTYASHGTLRQRHPKGSIVQLELVVSYVKQTASALQYTHDNKLIHRDVKPENLLLGRSDEVLLSDFGIAVTAHSSFSESMQNVVGTTLYMAPEQLRGRPCPASDQYALGIIVYEWLSGSPPFSGLGFMAVAIKHLNTPPGPLREKAPALSVEIEKVVMKAIAKEPSERFPSVQAFADALANASKVHIPLTVSSSLTTSHSPLPPDLVDVNSSGQTVAATIDPLTRTTTVASEGMTRQYHRLSRRVVTTALVSLAGLSSISGGIGWFVLKSMQGSVSTDQTTRTITVSTSLTELPSHPVGTTLLTYSKHTDSVTSLTWSPDGGNIASASLDKAVHVWSVTGKQTLVYTNHTDSVLTVAWSPSGQYLASGGKDKTIRVWLAPSTQPRLQGKPGDTFLVYQDHSTEVPAVAWSPDSQRIISIGMTDRRSASEVQNWDAVTGKHALYYSPLRPGSLNYAGTAVAWSPDGRYIVSSVASVVVWDATSGNPNLFYSGHQYELGDVYGLTWSPDGKYIASAGEDKTVLVWDATQGTTLFRYTGHSDAVNAVAWSPDGKYIASAGRDTTVQIWNPTTGNVLYTYRKHTAAVNAVIWAANSKHLASGGDDKTVLVWQGR